MNPDLHSHSHYSDGRHAPEFVLERAKSNGVTHLAITDHDCIDGMLELVESDVPAEIELISGVEVSVAWEGREIHVVGLCFDPGNDSLRRLLARQQERRRIRIGLIDGKLRNAGIEGLDEFLAARPCVSPTRTHVMEFLIERGIKRTHRQAFKLLSRQGRYYVRSSWCGFGEAIECIRQAGGVAVLAHPHRYGLSNTSLKKLLAEFRGLGGDGLEVACSNMKQDGVESLARLGEELGLLASVGSDFHTATATWMDLGRLPTLPERVKKNAIWSHDRWHSLAG